jgi:uncharacterized membrane protein
MAWQVGLESACASVLGGPLVAMLAEHAFGYQASTLALADAPDAQRRGNARALQLSLAAMTLLPWTGCLLCYLAVGRTYRHDRDRAKAASAIGTASNLPREQEQASTLGTKDA